MAKRKLKKVSKFGYNEALAEMNVLRDGGHQGTARFTQLEARCKALVAEARERGQELL